MSFTIRRVFATATLLEKSIPVPMTLHIAAFHTSSATLLSTIAAAAFAAGAIATTARADLTLSNFSITSSTLSFDLSGTMPSITTSSQLRITSPQTGAWGSDSWFLTNQSAMTIGTGAVGRVDVQSGANFTQVVIFLSQDYTTGAAVSGRVEVAIGAGYSFFDLGSRTFRISATPSSGSGTTLFDGLTAVPPPTLSTLSIAASDTTLQTGQTFTATVSATSSTATRTGVQLALNFDATKLRLDAVAPSAGGAFAAEIAEEIDNANGTLRYAAGVDETQSGTTGAGALVDLTFTTLTSETCASAGLVSFGTVSGTTSMFTLSDASTVVPSTTGLGSIRIDGTAPVLISIPASVSVATDAGSTFGAYVANPGVTVTDNCDTLAPTLLVTYPDGSTASAWPADGMFPIGTTALEWSVTDASGNSASAVRSVVVANHQLLDATVAFDGPFVSASSRSVRISAGASTQVVSLAASGSPLAAGSIGSIQVPVAAGYACVAAKDPSHSLTDSTSASISGVRYAATFALKQGDSNDDDMVDIADFGIFVAARGAGKALDATSNFNSDTAIGNGDFAYISINFFRVGDACGAFSGGQPLARIRVKDLRRTGRGDLEIADINRDGWIDSTDVSLFMQGIEPRRPSQPTPAAGFPEIGF